MTIKGDVSGLYGIGFDLGGAVQPMQSMVTAINKTVEALVSDAGWRGDAADSFRAAWEADSTAIGVVAKAVGEAEGAINELATSLSSAINALSDAKDAAVAKGLKFGADDIPLPTTDGATLTTYENAAKAAMKQASDARELAKQKLYPLLALCDPSTPGGASLLGDADAASLAALLHDYFYLPEGMAKSAHDKRIRRLQAKYGDAKEARRIETDPKIRKQLTQDMKGIRDALKSERADLAVAEFFGNDVKLGKWFNRTPADLLKNMGAVDRWVRIADQVPYLDIAAATFGTYATAREDHNRGWSWTHSIAADGGANLVGIAAEVASAETGPFAPLIGYAASSLATEFTHSTHWSKNIHDDGVVLGVGYSLAQGTWHTIKSDFADEGAKVISSIADPVGTAKGMWQGIFG
ncbi:WXG100 family type VII secretion target [Streptomyces silvisoli]|uniref:WXG100 family type VII secretion target n=1 Tax=Streptomyces silvisoli TaxID=3034235 RepID=A0ABT5ZR53_9ACTN|nr:hypothetical protein [Streptomyces silvisoli]MDF3292044.1 hypothetical protein [Streptomyces silvisoli]